MILANDEQWSVERDCVRERERVCVRERERECMCVCVRVRERVRVCVREIERAKVSKSVFKR